MAAKAVRLDVQLSGRRSSSAACAPIVRARAGSDDGEGEHGFVCIQHDHVRRGRAAVDAREILLHAPLFRRRAAGCPPAVRRSQAETLAEGLQPRGKLTWRGQRCNPIRFSAARARAFRLQIGVFKAVIIAEFDRVIDDAADVLVFIQRARATRYPSCACRAFGEGARPRTNPSAPRRRSRRLPPAGLPASAGRCMSGFPPGWGMHSESGRGAGG